MTFFQILTKIQLSSYGHETDTCFFSLSCCKLFFGGKKIVHHHSWTWCITLTQNQISMIMIKQKQGNIISFLKKWNEMKSLLSKDNIYDKDIDIKDNHR